MPLSCRLWGLRLVWAGGHQDGLMALGGYLHLRGAMEVSGRTVGTPWRADGEVESSRRRFGRQAWKARFQMNSSDLGEPLYKEAISQK